MEEKFYCERCGNTDLKFVGYRNGAPYCRKCITFNGEKVSYIPRKKGKVKWKLDFELSAKQQQISRFLKFNFLKGRNSLVHAVCGAGKTEIVYEVISDCLSKGGRVGFAIPRKDVVIELEPRLKKAFPDLKIISVYGQHHDELIGDIILLTTHQLYRYENFFDLLIMDEIDAFPYQGNETLENFMKKSIRGNYIMMSATLSNKVLESFDSSDLQTLFRRFHNYDLPEPKLFIKPQILQIVFIIKTLKNYQREEKQAFIFVPTVSICENLYKFLKFFIFSLDYVHSMRDKREEIIDKFKKKKIMILITTSILERGVTVKNLQVIVYRSDHTVFSRQTLTQIAGRVGRKKEFPEGDVYYLAKSSTSAIKDSIAEIRSYNKHM